MSRFDSTPVPPIDNSFRLTPVSPIDAKHNLVTAKAERIDDTFRLTPIEGLEKFEGPDYLSATRKAEQAIEQFNQDMLALETRYQEDLLRKGYSDPNAFMSDEFSRTTAGQFVNTAGALISGAGWLVNSIASSPQAMLEAGEAFRDETGEPSTNLLVQAAELTSSSLVRPFFRALDISGDVIESFTSKFYNTSELQRLQNELAQDYDDNTGATNIALEMGSTILSNPELIPQVIAQSLPTMYALSARGSVFAATYLGMVNSKAKEATDKFKLLHNGKTPTAEEAAIIYAGAAVSTTVETIESRFLLGKLAKTKLKPTFKARALGIATAPPKGIAAEVFEEGQATYIGEVTARQTLESLTSDETLRETSVSAALGGAAGGAIKTATTTLPGTAGLSLEGVDKGLNVLADKVNKRVALNTERATATAEAEEDYLRAVEVGLQVDITQIKDPQARIDHLTRIDENITKAGEQLEAAKANLSVEEANIFKNQLDEYNDRFFTLVGQLSDIQQKEKQEVRLSDVERIIKDQETTLEQTQEVVNTVVNAIQSGETVSERTITSIRGSNFFDSLSTEQKETIKLYEETQKSLGDVAKDIVEGNKKDQFLGIKQHTQNINKAIQLKNKPAAQKTLDQLVNFRKAIIAKLEQPSKNKKGEIYGTGRHQQSFINQLQGEIQALTNTIKLLSKGVENTFGEALLTTDQIETPKYEIYQPGKTVTPKEGSVAKKETTTESKKEKKLSPEIENLVDGLQKLHNNLKSKKAIDATDSKNFEESIKKVLDSNVSNKEKVKELWNIRKALQSVAKKDTKKEPVSPSVAKEETKQEETQKTMEQILKDLYPESVDVGPRPKQESTAIAEGDTAIKNSLKGFLLKSGGAYGADSLWDDIGKKFGVTATHYFLGTKGPKNAPRGNTEITEEDKKEGSKKAAEAAKAVWGYAYKSFKDPRIIRNWSQVRYANAIFAIGTIVQKGEKVFPNQPNDTRVALKPAVAGGTGYAVEMAIQANKSVYVFDQNKKQWFTWNGKDFVVTEIPILTASFAGIGTRNINKAGKKAIEDVYKKTAEKVVKKVFTIDDEQVEVTFVKELPNNAIAVNRNGKILMRSGVSREEFLQYAKGELHSYTSKQKEVVAKYMQQKFGVDINAELEKLDRNNLIKLIIAHEVGHSKQPNLKEKYLSNTAQTIAESFGLKDKKNKYLADSAIQFEAGANRYALKVLGITTEVQKETKTVSEVSEPLPAPVFETNTETKYAVFEKEGKTFYANANQTIAIDRLKNWWSNTKESLFILSGRGGTGKTTVIGTAIKEMGITPSQVMYALPTHKAKQVIQKATGDTKSTYNTIAGLLGYRPNPQRFTDSTAPEFIQDKRKYEQSLDKLSEKNIKIIVIDEASMLAESQIADLLRIQEELPVRFIFMGDNAQLPPIEGTAKGIKVSPVFSELSGLQKYSGISVSKNNTAVLLQRMRQEGESPILRITDIVSNIIDYLYARQTKTGKYSGKQATPNIILDKIDRITDAGSLLFKPKSDETIEEFVEEFKKNPFKTKWINFNNQNHKESITLRSKLRELLFPDVPDAGKIKNVDGKLSLEVPYIVGEHLMIGDTATTLIENSTNTETGILQNGEEVVVEALPVPAEVTISNEFGKDYENVPVDLLAVRLNNKVFNIVLPNTKTADDIFNKMSKNQQQYPNLATKIANSITSELGAGYIINSHKAQGSTYETVYADYQNITGSTNGSDWVGKLQALYVAVSRPTTKLVMVGRAKELGEGRTLNQILNRYESTPTEEPAAGSIPPSVDIKDSDIPTKSDGKPTPIAPDAETQAEAAAAPETEIEATDIQTEAFTLSLDVLPELKAVKEILATEIPSKSKYTESVLNKRRIAGYKTTFKDVITAQDDILRAIQEILDTCHG